MAAKFITIVIGTVSNSVVQLNQLQADSTNVKTELNQLIDYLGRIAGGNEIVTQFYVVTNNADPDVDTDGGDSTLTTYIGSDI